jgi:hypothetical protein
LKKTNLALLTFSLTVLTVSCIFLVPPAEASVGAPNSWATMAPMPTARASAGIGVVDGKIYAIGGGNEHSVSVNEMYDPATDTWTEKAPMPQAVGGPTVTCQNKIYCFGTGFTIVYDPATDSWANKTAMPTSRWALSASVVNDKIYLLGGFNGNFLGTPLRCDINEMYDPANDSWTTMAPLPVATAYCVSASIDEKIYLFGNTGSYTSKILVYDTQSNLWSIGPTNPYLSFYNSGGAITGVHSPKRFYFIGGSYGSSNSNFDPKTGVWSTGAEIPTPRLFLSVAVVDDLIYAIGGAGSSSSDPAFYATNERYTPFSYHTYLTALTGLVSSPLQNVNYTSSRVPLQFNVNGSFAMLTYMLDLKPNVSIAGNITLFGLTSGYHAVSVYAQDDLGNIFELETVGFWVTLQDATIQPDKTAAVTIAGVVTAASLIAATCLLLAHKKPKHQTKPSSQPET